MRGTPVDSENRANDPPYFENDARCDINYYYYKSRTGFSQVPKLTTLNNLERRNGRYFASCHRSPQLWVHCVTVVEVPPMVSAKNNIHVVFGSTLLLAIFLEISAKECITES